MPKNYSLQKGNTLEKLGNNNKWFLLSLTFIVLLFVGISFIVINQDNKHHEIKRLYAKAYVSYSTIDLNKPYTTNLDPNINETILLLSKVLEKNTSYDETYFALYNCASLYIFMGEKEKALPYLIKLQKAPSSFILKPKALTMLARLYIEKEQWQKAIDTYKEMSRSKDVVRDFSFYELGLLYTKTGNIEEALHSYKEVNAKSSLYSLAQRNIFMIHALTQKNN